MLLKAFPDANDDMNKIFADINHVIARNTFKGTHEGEFRVCLQRIMIMTLPSAKRISIFIFVFL